MNLTVLPKDLMVVIAGYLPLRDVCSLRLCCRHTRVIGTAFWSLVCAKQWNTEETQLVVCGRDGYNATMEEEVKERQRLLDVLCDLHEGTPVEDCAKLVCLALERAHRPVLRRALEKRRKEGKRGEVALAAFGVVFYCLCDEAPLAGDGVKEWMWKPEQFVHLRYWVALGLLRDGRCPASFFNVNAEAQEFRAFGTRNWTGFYRYAYHTPWDAPMKMVLSVERVADKAEVRVKGRGADQHGGFDFNGTIDVEMKLGDVVKDYGEWEWTYTTHMFGDCFLLGVWHDNWVEMEEGGLFLLWPEND